MPIHNPKDAAELLRHPLLAQVAQGLNERFVPSYPATPPKPAADLAPIPSRFGPDNPMRVELPGDWTLAQLAERFPRDRYRLVRQVDGVIRIEERQRNAALRVVGAAHIIRNAASDAVPTTTKEA